MRRREHGGVVTRGCASCQRDRPRHLLILALALTFPVWITVNWLGSPDNGVILAGYVGSLMLSGTYLAISCMTSAMTRNQVISFIVSVVLCLFLILAGFSPVTDLLARWASPAFVDTVAASLSMELA